MKYRIGIITLLVLFLGGFVVSGKHHKKTKQKSRKSTQIVGIDVSKHTGDIQWETIKRQGINFAYIKSTEGVDYLDPRYSYNVVEAKNAGIPVGAYHFFRFHRNGIDQANNFLSQVSINDLDLPPVVDVEEWGQYNDSKNAECVVIELQAFISAIENRSSRKVVIYADKNSYKKYIAGRFRNNRIWICSLGTPPQIDQKWCLWQKSHNSKLSGTRGKIDMNLFNGDHQDWKDFMAN